MSGDGAASAGPLVIPAVLWQEAIRLRAWMRDSQSTLATPATTAEVPILCEHLHEGEEP